MLYSKMPNNESVYTRGAKEYMHIYVFEMAWPKSNRVRINPTIKRLPNYGPA